MIRILVSISCENRTGERLFQIPLHAEFANDAWNKGSLKCPYKREHR